MMKNIAAFFGFALFFRPALFAAQGNEFNLESRGASSIRLSAAAIPAPSAAQPQRAVLKEWTVMVFLNGKNNLESSAMVDINQMELIGTTTGVNIVVELGRAKVSEGDDASDGDWTGVRRYLITKDTDLKHIASPVLDYRKGADMGSWKELANFVKWSKAAYPARRYALILWDHGNGWKPVDYANAGDFANTKGFSLDEETGHEISTLQMAAALKSAGRVDFFMADGCNMQMASVAYEMRNSAEVMVASEETEPAVFLRYARFLTLLNDKPRSQAAELGLYAVRTYRDYFFDGGDPEETNLTQSAVRLDKMAALRSKLDLWAALAMKEGEKDILISAKTSARSYADPEYKDLYHFISLVTAGTKSPALRASGKEVMRFLKDGIIIENWGQDKNSNGLSIYVPDVYDRLYDKLAWSRDGIWDDFAKFMAGLK